MASAIIGLPGVVILYWQLGWLPTVGLLLAMWGNNIMLGDQGKPGEPK